MKSELMLQNCVNGPCLLDYLILKLRLPVVLYVSFAVVSR